jgi:transposase
MPGIGPSVASTLIGDLPELGSLSRLNRDSGTFHGKRRIRGGRAHSRTALFLSAMVAIRYNLDIKRFYERLLQTGKHKKGRPHRLHPQNRHRSQRYAARQPALAVILRLTQDHSRLLGDTIRADRSVRRAQDHR